MDSVPHPPRELCSSEEDYELGIVSPSLYFDYCLGAKCSENVDKYFKDLCMLLNKENKIRIGERK